ncbi:MAG: type II toxin-antitoxin system RelE/ParE family toxin [Gallionella sp.]|nr:MAG: type II toxin-antitoxin system RelE/ParE family toxin [Gallionella sp.]
MPTKSKRLDWAESALDELGVGIAHYAERNPVAAQRMLKEINHAAVSISQARMSLENCLPLVESLVATEVPSKGRPGRLAGTRELVVVGSRTPYIRVFSEVKHPQPAIQILRVMHTARKFP